MHLIFNQFDAYLFEIDNDMIRRLMQMTGYEGSLVAENCPLRQNFSSKNVPKIWIFFAAYKKCLHFTSKDPR